MKNVVITSGKRLVDAPKSLKLQPTVLPFLRHPESLRSRRLTRFGVWQMVYGDERSRHFLFRKMFVARYLELFDVRSRSK